MSVNGSFLLLKLWRRVQAGLCTLELPVEALNFLLLEEPPDEVDLEAAAEDDHEGFEIAEDLGLHRNE